MFASHFSCVKGTSIGLTILSLQMATFKNKTIMVIKVAINNPDKYKYIFKDVQKIINHIFLLQSLSNLINKLTNATF